VLSGDAPLWVEAHWVTEIESVLDAAKAKKIRVVLMGATEAPRILERIKSEKAMVALSDPTDASPDDLDVLLHREDLASTLTKAGIPIVVTTAGGSRNGVDGLPFLVALHMGSRHFRPTPRGRRRRRTPLAPSGLSSNSGPSRRAATRNF
jgi:hypothetical protein